MRSGLLLLLPIAACFAPNPTFGLVPETSTGADPMTGSSGVTSEAPTTSTGTGPNTTATTVTSDTGDTTATASATSEALTSTGEPLTSSTGDTDHPDLPAPMCGFAMAGDQIRHVFDDVLGADITDCDVSSTWIGPMKMTGGTLRLNRAEDCKALGEPAELLIGEGWPAAADSEYGCVKATVFWITVEGECRIGTLEVIEYNADVEIFALPLYLAALSRLDPPMDFPMWPALELDETCGCPEDVVGCCMPDAGHYAFKVESGVSVTAQSTHTFKSNNDRTYTFTNLQSYIDGDCIEGAPNGIHLDWFSEVLPP